MKKYLLIAFAAGSFLLTGASIATAAEPMKMSQADIVAMCKTMSTEDCRLMMREMLKKGTETKKAMIEELKKDSEFRSLYETHNPSGHS